MDLLISSVLWLYVFTFFAFWSDVCFDVFRYCWCGLQSGLSPLAPSRMELFWTDVPIWIQFRASTFIIQFLFEDPPTTSFLQKIDMVTSAIPEVQVNGHPWRWHWNRNLWGGISSDSGFQEWGYPIAGWCIVVNPITMDDLGGTPIEEGNYFQINVMINSHGREPSISHFPINQTQLSSSDQNPLFISLYWVQWGVLLDSLTEMIIIILVILILVIIIFHDGNPDQPVEPIRDLKSCIIIG